MKKLTCILNGLIIGFLLAGLAGCQANQITSTAAATNSSNPTKAQAGATLPAAATVTAEAALPGATLSPTGTKKTAATKPNLTATPDTRLPPDQWQKWPYVPTISARAIEIYKKGLAMGNDPHSFSIAGDCQSIVGAFLSDYDNPYGYNLDPAYNYLRDTVDLF